MIPFVAHGDFLGIEKYKNTPSNHRNGERNEKSTSKISEELEKDSPIKQ